MVSLIMSWVFAVTVTPLVGAWLLKPASSAAESGDPYAGRFYRKYREKNKNCIRP